MFRVSLQKIRITHMAASATNVRWMPTLHLHLSASASNVLNTCLDTVSVSQKPWIVLLYQFQKCSRLKFLIQRVWLPLKWLIAITEIHIFRWNCSMSSKDVTTESVGESLWMLSGLCWMSFTLFIYTRLKKVCSLFLCAWRLYIR